MLSERPARILLDRDGVLNVETPGLHVISPATFQWIDGSEAALHRLFALGWRPGLATNQSVIGRGLVTQQSIEALHDLVFEGLISAGQRFVCPHAPDAECRCRKPKPELIMKAADHWGVAPATILFVGDALSDWTASQAAGTMFALVETGKGAETKAALEGCGALETLWGSQVFADLSAVVDFLAQVTQTGQA